MAISVGGLLLDGASTVVREQYEVVGGKQTRAIRITGLVRGAGNLAALVDALDAIAKSASDEAPIAVSLRSGRQLSAHREAFSRDLNARALTGQFVLDLRAEDTWEESESLHSEEWAIAFSGATLILENAGNAVSPVSIAIEAEDDLITPGVSDGSRLLRYEGTVPNGSLLLINGPASTVLLDGVDMTPYTSGEFPALAPGHNTLTYTDDPGSSHAAAAIVTFRDRWW